MRVRAPCLCPQVAAAIAAKEALQAAKDVRTLIAVDDYNALYWQTGEPPLCTWQALCCTPLGCGEGDLSGSTVNHRWLSPLLACRQPLPTCQDRAAT